MTDLEWKLTEPYLPEPASRTASGGRPEAHDRRDIIDAIRYTVDNGNKWRALPADYPNWRTTWGYFARWAADGTTVCMMDGLRREIRVNLGRCPNAVTAIIDSQSVKAAETVGKDTRGFDAGKLIEGRKRHLLVDTRGLLLAVLVTPADIHDAPAAKQLLAKIRPKQPQLTLIWGDHGYA
ncbi:MAG: IS5 family transposase, partial [Dehalococcoidia bacterium]